MSKFLVLLIAIAMVSALPIREAGYYVTKCTTSDRDSCSVTHSATAPADGSYVAFCRYAPTLTERGWDLLSTKTTGPAPAPLQAYAVGLCEGYATGQRTRNHRHNIHTFMLNRYMKAPAWPESIHNYVQANEDYVRAQSTANAANDDYWFGVSLYVAQIDGLVAGMNVGAATEDLWTTHDMFMYQASGELLDLHNYLSLNGVPNPQGVSARFNWKAATPLEREMHHATSNRCSGLVRLSPDHTDIWISQVAWFTFGSMTRVLKTTELGWAGQRGQKAGRLSFSSYPSFIFSFDDFYTSDQQIAAFETTNSVYDNSLYDRNQPLSVFTFMRAPLASRMASSAPEWAQVFARENSGTYNNQWDIVDFKLLGDHAGARLQPNTFVLLEQVPGMIEYKDMTKVLENDGYFASTNTYRLPSMARVAGQTAHAALDKTASYEGAPRRHVFKRRIELDGKCKTYDEFRALMRYNNPAIPEQLSNPGYGIAARYDHRAESPLAFGGLDAKSTRKANMRQGAVLDAIAGPTRGDPNAAPVFEPWQFKAHADPTNENANPLVPPHVGLPENVDWAFDWQMGFGANFDGW